MYFGSVVSREYNYNRCQSVYLCVLMLGDIMLDEVIEVNRCMVQAHIMGCQVGKCLEEVLTFHSTSVNGILNNIYISFIGN